AEGKRCSSLRIHNPLAELSEVFVKGKCGRDAQPQTSPQRNASGPCDPRERRRLRYRRKPRSAEGPRGASRLLVQILVVLLDHVRKTAAPMPARANRARFCLAT